MHETYFQHIRTDMISFSRLFRAQNSICMCQFPSVFIIVLQKMIFIFFVFFLKKKKFHCRMEVGVTRLPLVVGLFHSPRTSQETDTLPPHTHHAPQHTLSLSSCQHSFCLSFPVCRVWYLLTVVCIFPFVCPVCFCLACVHCLSCVCARSL